MKIRRYKRVQRILSFYRNNFGFEPPYNVLLDGTFFVAAKEHKLNIREQLGKYLNDAECRIETTQCVLDELQQLGPSVYAGLHIARQFDVRACTHGHKTEPSSAKCLYSAAKRCCSTQTHNRCLIGTQDRELTTRFNSLPGVPVLFINYQTILIEKPSVQSQQTATAQGDAKIKTGKRQKSELEILRDKLGIADDTLAKPRRKRKRGGPNPLSCKKKKKAGSVPQTASLSTNDKKKRVRRKKKAKLDNTAEL